MPLGPMKTKKQKRAGMKTVMDEFKSGKLRSGSKSGPKVTNPKQAIAIGLSQTGQSRGGKGKPPAKKGRAGISVAEFERKHGNKRI